MFSRLSGISHPLISCVSSAVQLNNIHVRLCFRADVDILGGDTYYPLLPVSHSDETSVGIIYRLLKSVASDGGHDPSVNCTPGLSRLCRPVVQPVWVKQLKRIKVHSLNESANAFEAVFVFCLFSLWVVLKDKKKQAGLCCILRGGGGVSHREKHSVI